MSRVLVTTDYLGPGDDIDTLLRRHGHEVTYAPARRARNRAEALALFDGIDGAVIASEPITADMLETATSLKVIARSGVGYDSVDLAAAARHGVRVCNTPGVNHDAVAEMTIALILTTARKLSAVLCGVRDGRWPRDAGRELRGSTLGIIGYGPSGRAVAQLGLAFGMSVAVHTAHPTGDPGIEFVDLDTVTATADYLSLHTRAAATTEHLIDRKRLQAMKNTAVLINTARGSLVDEDALADALEAGDIAGAALDVVAREPLPADSRLRGLDNVLITSHLAGQTVEARNRAGLAAAQAVIDVLAGREPAHPVDKETV
ncbi:phosphoglycerate dehydrogenase [Rhodococcus opacus]|uniref:phosphoglycerate dehydrogenase n=1 Tax=Rhodococcus opacus TaxID=37919 RepID=UPI0002A203B2|nr:phosphoglycerate dehydrogenase [Rhodococcus opacus]ELB94706.1 phosphoglycerate dehydrogenase [Rhodococcus wratislaviensis IFP 2016]MDX5962881.1 phosphoglycerate dehydrogenase [Rhodococcus opacus]NKY69902.1 phosphoglycerate dehydrogenase [Rhodococcus opacus]QZS54603.1 phosphoglycerate dehydrogenase [Rhodococcus opacus]RKM72322.1 hydroxyacid dehydrogenase [Rhodococcus opacus]